jgi:hypothetical protein
MSAPLPFNVSNSAEKRLREVGSVPNMQPGIFRTLRYEAHKDGELSEQFDEEHYSIGFDSPESWVSVRFGIQVTIAGREFWLSPDTLETLRDKTLTMIQREVGRGRYAGKLRDFLVAT